MVGVASAAAAADAVLDLLLPAVCPLCREAAGPGLCDGCRALLPAVNEPCALCGMPKRESPCPACRDDGLIHLDAKNDVLSHPS